MSSSLWLPITPRLFLMASSDFDLESSRACTVSPPAKLVVSRNCLTRLVQNSGNLAGSLAGSVPGSLPGSLPEAFRKALLLGVLCLLLSDIEGQFCVFLAVCY